MSDEMTAYDRRRGALDGLPGALWTKPSPVQTIEPMLGTTTTWIVQTVRHEGGDIVFVESLSAIAHLRIVLEPKVAEVIARQSAALSTRARSIAGRLQAAERKAAGIVPGFLRPGAKQPMRKGGRKKKRRRMQKG